MWWWIAAHFRIAISGVTGVLNLAIGSVSIFRQIVRAFSIGVSPVLQGVFATYVQLFHGALDFLAAGISWMSPWEVAIPSWAHDWIIMWLVFSGAAFRLAMADDRVRAVAETQPHEEEDLPDRFGKYGVRPIIQDLSIPINYTINVPKEYLPRVLGNFFAYLLCIFLWPVVAWQLLTIKSPNVWSVGHYLDVRLVFLVQTGAILLGIVTLSAMNVQV